MTKWRSVLAVSALFMGCAGGSQDTRPSPSDPDTGQGTPSSQGTVELMKSFLPPAPGKPPDPAVGFPETLTAGGNKLYFSVKHGDLCCGLWMSDATPQGTVPLKAFDQKVDKNHVVREIAPVGDQVFFVATDVTATGSAELWVSDGTPSGAHLVKAITPGQGKKPTDTPSHGLAALDKSLLFFQTSTAPEHTELWKSDGTPAGTVRVKDLGANSTVGQGLVAGKTFYFAASDPDHGAELWKSDGTESGTQLVQDLAPGASGSNPSDFQTDGTSLYFTASVNAHKSLWKSEGGAAGLVLPLDQDTTEDTMAPLAMSGKTLFLNAVGKDNLLRLYGMNLGGPGPAQRQLIATLPNATARDGYGQPRIAGVAAGGGKLYFTQYLPYRQTPSDLQLWVTDGTPAGTRLLKNPLYLSDEYGTNMAVVGGRVLTAANSKDTGIEPWVSDGTVEGTHEVKDLAPGYSSFPRLFTTAGNRVFFVAYDLQNGHSLWVFKPGS